MGKYDAPHDEQIKDIARHTLSHFGETAERVREELNIPKANAGNALAGLNTLTNPGALPSMNNVGNAREHALRALLAEPAIARIVTEDDEGVQRIYFVSNATPHRTPSDGSLVVSYNVPLGRLASLPVGGDLDAQIRGDARTLTVLQRTLVRPVEKRGEWDSVKSTIESDEFGPLTIPSLRALLEALGVPTDDLDELEAALASDHAKSLVLEGIRRDAIEKMELRDLAVLDQYQDEIFRLPLDSRLVILGPPGTGKTTTLIKRLRQKLDQPSLEEDERSIIEASRAGSNGHQGSWTMFTPTPLLKQYVKEAFARQNVAAPDQRIQTWDDFRRDLARHQFGLLRSGTGRGQLVMREDLRSLLPATIIDQRKWFEDFDALQKEAFWADLREQAQTLNGSRLPEVEQLRGRIAGALPSNDAALNPSAIATLTDLAAPLQAFISSSKEKTDKALRGAIAAEFRKDSGFLDALLKFASELESDDEGEDDDAEVEDEDEPRATRVGREAAVDTLMRALRARARSVASGRSVGKRTRNGRILDWLGERGPSRDQLKLVGEEVLLQTSARRFLYPARKLVDGIARRYRTFRRERQSESVWYHPEGFQLHELSPLEVDVVLLSIMRTSNGLLGDRRIARAADEAAYSSLAAMSSLHRTQVLVDEATDFSPVQLACMGSLCDPAARSFLACGDFNQRITEWGSRSNADLSWVFDDFYIRSVSITYRHSRQLNELARAIALLSSPDVVEAQLPQRVNNDGFDPVLAANLSGYEDTAAWIAKRVKEIEVLAETLPPIAVLVSSEAHVKPTADAIDRALIASNIRAVPCHEGVLAGQDNDVRVFDVRHIKGLEFEAVFFLGLDSLEEAQPELFERYLYVGATRAALFLGLTTAKDALPEKLASLADRFVTQWPKGRSQVANT